MAEVFFFESQQAFNDYLLEHLGETEIWVGYFKKDTGIKSINWSQSVDVALCYGWIDGVRQTIDEQRYKIRFTPRKKASVWSAVNVKKVEALIKLGKMSATGMDLFNNRRDKQGYSANNRNVALANVYEAQIKANQSAWQFFNNLAPGYKRDSIWWVMSAKKPETQIRRLRVLIESSELKLKIPMLRKT